MFFNIYKSNKVNENNKFKKNIIIGCVAIATTTTLIYKNIIKANKEKIDKRNKEKELKNIINEIEDISNKIVSMSQTQAQIDELMKEKDILKKNFIFKPM